MYQKPEPTSEPSSLYHVLNVVEQLCQTTRSMLDTSSPSLKEAMLESMAHLIAAAIALQEANSELNK